MRAAAPPCRRYVLLALAAVVVFIGCAVTVAGAVIWELVHR